MSSAPPSPPGSGSSSVQVRFNPSLRVCVTGAAGKIAYTLLEYLPQQTWAQGLELFLLDIPPAMEILRGVVMELEDLSSPQLRAVLATDIPGLAFQGADLVIMLGSTSRKPGQEIPDLLDNNVTLFKEHAHLLDKKAQKNAKVLVVGNPCNVNSWVCKEHSRSLNTRNFTALSRLDLNRAISFVAQKKYVKTDQVKNIVIWGNHSSAKIIVDLSHGFVSNYPTNGINTSLKELLTEDEALELQEHVRTRSSRILLAREVPPRLSCAAAILDHLQDWYCGTPPGEYVSMVVESDGSYGIPQGMMFSMPVTCQNGEYEIVRGLDLEEDIQRSIFEQVQALNEEKLRADEVLAAS